MELKRITNSNDEEAQKLIALHRDTFSEYERFQETSLLANLIDNAESMHFNGIYEDTSWPDSSFIGIWRIHITSIL